MLFFTVLVPYFILLPYLLDPVETSATSSFFYPDNSLWILVWSVSGCPFHPPEYISLSLEMSTSSFSSLSTFAPFLSCSPCSSSLTTQPVTSFPWGQLLVFFLINKINQGLYMSAVRVHLLCFFPLEHWDNLAPSIPGSSSNLFRVLSPQQKQWAGICLANMTHSLFPEHMSIITLLPQLYAVSSYSVMLTKVLCGASAFQMWHPRTLTGTLYSRNNFLQ